MNWQKIKEHQKLSVKVESMYKKRLKNEPNAANNKEEIIEELFNLAFSFFELHFNSELLRIFINFIRDNSQIIRRDIPLSEFQTYLKQYEKCVKEIEGFSINDETHLEYLVVLINQKFPKIPFEFTSEYIKKYNYYIEFNKAVKYERY